MITENLSTLKIHKLTKAQYERELEAGRIDENALYLTPDEEVDMSLYATVEQLNGKADATHSHAISEVTDLQSTLDTNLQTAKSYTDTKTSGLASETTIASQISTHNTATTAHNDIRGLISDLTTKLNNFLDVDDTTSDQLSEVLEMINNNKGTLESLTTNKVNVSDIIDNLETASADKVLSANQGVEIKKLIDALQESINGIEPVQPDWNQSDETASDFIKNKPFGESNGTQQVIVTEDDINYDNTIYDEVNWLCWIKLTDISPQKEEIVSTEFTFLDAVMGDYQTHTFTSATDLVEGKIYQLNNEVEYMGDINYPVYVVLEDGVEYLGAVWSKGIWSRYDDSMGTLVCGLNFSTNVTVLKTIEDKYIPNTIARKSEIPSVPTKVSELENDANYKVTPEKITLFYGEDYDVDSIYYAYDSGNIELCIYENSSDTGMDFKTYDVEVLNSDSAEIIISANINGYKYMLNNYSGWSKELISNDGFYRSKRDFEHGTLITTNLDYSADNGAVWLLELKGNSYVDQIPFDIHLQGYIYKDENNTAGMINYGGFSNGRFFDDIDAFCYNGQLCFWFPRLGYWQGFDVRVSNELSETTNSPNCVVSITDEVKPTNITKEISFKGLIVESINVNNIQYQAVYSATHDSNNNNIVETYATKEELSNMGGSSGSSSPAFIDFNESDFNIEDLYTAKIRKQLDDGSYIYATLSKVKTVDEYDTKHYIFTAFDLDRNCICQITMDDGSLGWTYTERSLATTEVVETQLLGGEW